MPPLQGHPPTQHPGAAQAELAQQSPERLANPAMRLWGFASRMRERTAADHQPDQNPDAAANGPSRLGLRTKVAILAGGFLSSAAIFIPGGATAAEQAPRADSAPVPAAQESARRGKGMQPAGVIKAISGVLARAHNSSGYGVPNTRLAKLTPNSSLLQGRCKPKDGWLPKRIATRQGKSFDVYCNGESDGGTKLITPTEYSGGLNWLGNRVATSAGVPAEFRGSTTKATATPRRAVIRFANDDPNAQVEQLKALILRKGKNPIPRWYPAQQ